MILNLIRKIQARLAYRRRLRAFRSIHPTCRIQNAHFDDVNLGEYCALLEGAYLKQVTMGRYSYVSYGSSVINTKVGSFCSIGPHVQIGLGPHPSRDYVSTYPAFYSPENSGCPQTFTNSKTFNDSVPETTVGSDVWIGSNVIIPGGIVIGNGAIIAAGSVVVRDVPAYAIVGGNPAQLIRHRFNESDAALIQATEWWNWPREKLLAHRDYFSHIEKLKAILSK